MMHEWTTRAAVAALAVVAGAGFAVADDPAPTGVTVQGRLVENATALSGTYDLRFRLYDAATGGTEVATEITCENVAVEAGLFAVSLLFDDPLDGGDRWLEIDFSDDDGDTFTPLLPRRPFGRAPQADYAQFATSAGNGVERDEVTGVVELDNGLEVFGDIVARGGNLVAEDTIFWEGDAGAAIYMNRDTPGFDTDWSLSLSFNGKDGLSFYDETFDVSRLFLANDGTVGIGTESPRTALEVVGDTWVTGTLHADRLDRTEYDFGVSNFIDVVPPIDPSTPLWLRFRSQGSIGVESWSGPVLSFRGESHWFTTNRGSDLLVSFSTENSETPDYSLATPVFRFTPAGDAQKPGGGEWSVLSDRRTKRNVRPLTGALGRLLSLEGVTYEYVDSGIAERPAGRHVGLIAQQVAETFPDWVSQGSDGLLRVSVKGLAPLTAEALRELRAEKDAEIRALHDEITALDEGIAERDARIADLEARLSRLESIIASLGDRR